jgi:hypothetical protein
LSWADASGTRVSRPGEELLLLQGKKRLPLHGCLARKIGIWQNTNSMDAKTFFRELRRRNVHKVAVVYAVIGWLLIEATSLLLFGHEERTSAMRVMLAIVAFGFLVALYISWAFEATPEGLKRTANVPPDAVLPTWSRRKFAAFIIVTALLAASLLAFDLLRNRSNPPSSPSTVGP